MAGRSVPLVGLCVLLVTAGRVAAAEPSVGQPAVPLNGRVALWVESFTVAPSSRPLAYVLVKNLHDVPYQGSVAMKVPNGWWIAPPVRELSLKPGESKRVPFNIERGVTVEANCYPIEVTATGAGVTVSRKQDVVCTSAPYFKPTIDGDPNDWKDAIPVAFTTGGKKTTISSYWTRRQFSLLVAAEEDKLIGYRGDPASGEPDAVQVAISPQDTTTGTSSEDEAARYEFLFVHCGNGTGGKCFQLAQPGMKLAESQQLRELPLLAYDEAEVAVKRQDGITYYEIAIPFGPMRNQIRPSEGREFCLSVLVHDPDGTGIRDWGDGAGLWPWRRNRLAWSRWQGALWGEKPPFDNKLPWGLCSSKY